MMIIIVVVVVLHISSMAKRRDGRTNVLQPVRKRRFLLRFIKCILLGITHRTTPFFSPDGFDGISGDFHMVMSCMR